MGGRAVECTGLENRQRRKSLVGSNPTPSAFFGSTVAFRRARYRFIHVIESWSTVAIDTHTKYGTCATATQG
jgi:hypothetical protein